jgi:LemA protein
MIASVILVVLLFVVVGLILYFVTIYNGLVALKNNIQKAWANIDVLLKQRYDELPKLVTACEAYMKHEKDTLARVIELRNQAQAAPGVAARADKEAQLTTALRQVFALAENYPDLKAQSSFQHLQERISGLENQIADRREFYNESVNNYNIRIQVLPDVLVARALNYQPHEMFQIAATEREDVKLNFSNLQGA